MRRWRGGDRARWPGHGAWRWPNGRRIGARARGRIGKPPPRFSNLKLLDPALPARRIPPPGSRAGPLPPPGTFRIERGICSELAPALRREMAASGRRGRERAGLCSRASDSISAPSLAVSLRKGVNDENAPRLAGWAEAPGDPRCGLPSTIVRVAGPRRATLWRACFASTSIPTLPKTVEDWDDVRDEGRRHGDFDGGHYAPGFGGRVRGWAGDSRRRRPDRRCELGLVGGDIFHGRAAPRPAVQPLRPAAGFAITGFPRRRPLPLRQRQPSRRAASRVCPAATPAGVIASDLKRRARGA